MREKIEQMDYYFNLMMEFTARRTSDALREFSSSEINESHKYRHRVHLKTIYIEFLTEKINRLKLEL
jgi:hypothetical protein